MRLGAKRVANVGIAILLQFSTGVTVQTQCANIGAGNSHGINPGEVKAMTQSVRTLLDARPMVRWWWFGIAVEKQEILRELRQIKDDGFGGVELAFVYPQALDDPERKLVNSPFLSSAMLSNVRYAQQQARKLGLRVDITLGSGWPYGGPATTLDEAAWCLRVAEIVLPVEGGPLPEVKLAEGEYIISIALARGEPKHWNSATAKTIAANSIVEPSSEPRVALFFIASHTKQVVKRAAVRAEGWVLDPFSRQAVAHHLKAVGGPLLEAFGNNPPYAIFSDSLQVFGADWAPSLPTEFRKRRGYDLIPHLPELIDGSTLEAATVRHDWGETLTELIDQNYLRQINYWARAHQTKFRSQTYGDPAVSLSSQRLVALSEGEDPQWRAFSTLRWATSANHLYGHNISSAETFTWLHSPVFRATPLDMKAEADLHFLIGVNQIIGHGWPYSPPQVGEPGWSLYAAAVLNHHNPWYPVMPAVTDYIQRISGLLREGRPANQVAVLLPTDDAWAMFSPGHVSLTELLAQMLPPGLIPAILNAGYNFDFIDADAVARRGIHYPILVLPPTDRIPIATLLSIRRLVARGGKVISVGRVPSLAPNGAKLSETTALPRQLFSAEGRTFVADDSQLGEALHKAATPDLQLTSTQEEIGFIRRRRPAADIYFVANTSNRSVSTTANLASCFRNAEVIDPATGETGRATKRNIQLQLLPYESRIIVISNTPTNFPPSLQAPATLVDLTNDWQMLFAATPNLKSVEHVLPDWTANEKSKNYSGEVQYQRNFWLDRIVDRAMYLEIDGGHAIEIDSPNEGNGIRAWYEGPVREAAIAYINGQKAGYLWHPPYRLDITKFVRAGSNRIELRVYNTAMNAWAAEPPHDYQPLIARYGRRFQMQDLDKVAPIASGILGEIKIATALRKRRRSCPHSRRESQ